jgi:hypothetical protein
LLEFYIECYNDSNFCFEKLIEMRRSSCWGLRNEIPAIEPIFCVRFNDLDNIGLTGRHYSGFVMLGIHVFNKPENYIFFKE